MPQAAPLEEGKADEGKADEGKADEGKADDADDDVPVTDEGIPVSKAEAALSKSRHDSVRIKMEQITASVILEAGEIYLAKSVVLPASDALM